MDEMAFRFGKGIDAQGASQTGAEFGKNVMNGIGKGIEDSAESAITAMENVYVELETVTKNAAKNAEKLEKKRQKRQLENLKNSLELELICEREYFEKLKTFRDENLRHGSDMWYKCTEEIAAYNQRLVSEAEKQYQKILELRNELGEKLKSDEPWAKSSKVRFLGMGQNGTDLVYDETLLDDFEEEIRVLEEYRRRIIELKNLGGVPDGVFEDIGKLDVEKGLAAANAILLADEKTRENFLEGYKTRDSLSQSVAGDLLGILNSKTLKEEGIQNTGSFLEILTDSFDEVPEKYFTLGEDAGEEFGDGFLAKIPEIMEETKNYFSLAISEIAEKMMLAMKNTAEKTAGNVSNTYQTSYTFNSSRDTTTQQLNAARNADVINRLRGGN